MNNENLAIYDLRFYAVDEDGNELLNDDGTIKLFIGNRFIAESSLIHLADGIGPNDLMELKA
jgi:hypothetical protein